MAIVQTIKYNSDNRYFAGFLQSIIDESNIDGYVEFRDGTIRLVLNQNDREALERFSELSNRYLPQSIFLSDIETNIEDIEVKKSRFKSEPYNISLCPKCLEMISTPSSPHYLDDKIECHHYSNDEAFKYSDNSLFSPHYTEGSVVLLCDSKEVDNLFILTQREKEILFSIEKPTIKATIRDEELKELTGKKYIYLKAPFDIRSTLVAINAKDSDISYLFFQDNSDLKVITIQDNISIIRADRVAKELKALHQDSVINRFLNILDEANFAKAVGAYISTKGISFLIDDSKEVKRVIEFREFDLEDTLEQMRANPVREKLLKNFANSFRDSYERLIESKSRDIFETLATILDIPNPSFESLSDKSLEFRGNGGLKIDMNFDENFDYASMIGSVMSFKLAGAEDFFIAYSIFEALGDMTISVLNQLKKKFDIKESIMMGDIFSNSVFYSRILSKYQIHNPYFSKDIALDE